MRRFQSLFFWMLLSKVLTWPDGAIWKLFQSLFFWMLLSKTRSVLLCRSVFGVSILIFLDASL